MTNFQSINRLMGTGQEMLRQAKNGAFSDRLGNLMERVDPFWEDREETEMDIYYRQGPLEVTETEDGIEEKPTRTARSPNEDEEHRVHAEVIVSDLIPKGEAGLEEIE